MAQINTRIHLTDLSQHASSVGNRGLLLRRTRRFFSSCGRNHRHAV